MLVASLVCILQSFNLCTCRVSHSSLYVCCTLTSICGPRLYVMAVMAMMFCSWKVTSNRLIVLASMTSVWFLYRTNCNGSSVSLFKFCFSTTLFNWVLSSFTPQLITHTHCPWRRAAPTSPLHWSFFVLAARQKKHQHLVCFLPSPFSLRQHCHTLDVYGATVPFVG